MREARAIIVLALALLVDPGRSESVGIFLAGAVATTPHPACCANSTHIEPLLIVARRELGTHYRSVGECTSERLEYSRVASWTVSRRSSPFRLTCFQVQPPGRSPPRSPEYPLPKRSKRAAGRKEIMSREKESGAIQSEDAQVLRRAVIVLLETGALCRDCTVRIIEEVEAETARSEIRSAGLV